MEKKKDRESSSPTEMRVVGHELGNIGPFTCMWVKVGGDLAAEWPKECGCDDKAAVRTEIIDEIKDFGWIRQRTWAHYRADGKRRHCVMLGIKRPDGSFLPMTPDAYAEYNREYVRAYDERNADA